MLSEKRAAEARTAIPVVPSAGKTSIDTTVTTAVSTHLGQIFAVNNGQAILAKEGTVMHRHPLVNNISSLVARQLGTTEHELVLARDSKAGTHVFYLHHAKATYCGMYDAKFKRVDANSVSSSLTNAVNLTPRGAHVAMWIGVSIEVWSLDVNALSHVEFARDHEKHSGDESKAKTDISSHAAPLFAIKFPDYDSTMSESFKTAW